MAETSDFKKISLWFNRKKADLDNTKKAEKLEMETRHKIEKTNLEARYETLLHELKSERAQMEEKWRENKKNISLGCSRKRKTSDDDNQSDPTLAKRAKSNANSAEKENVRPQVQSILDSLPKLLPKRTNSLVLSENALLIESNSPPVTVLFEYKNPESLPSTQIPNNSNQNLGDKNVFYDQYQEFLDEFELECQRHALESPEQQESLEQQNGEVYLQQQDEPDNNQYESDCSFIENFQWPDDVAQVSPRNNESNIQVIENQDTPVITNIDFLPILDMGGGEGTVDGASEVDEPESESCNILMTPPSIQPSTMIKFTLSQEED
jgi:hypothetical protein